MENVCHTLVGGVLARAGLDRLSPLATPTMLVAANLPDVDVVAGWWGDLAYLEHHRGITHSVLGLLVEAPLLAAAVVAWDRGVRRRRDPQAIPVRFGPLVVVALAGLASHVLLDLTNSYGIKPWLPFDATWYYGDLVFIVDPWLWLMLGGALWLGARRTRANGLLWSGLFAAFAVAVAMSGALAPMESVGPAATAVWFVGLGCVVTARALGRSPTARNAAFAALVLTCAYWGALTLAHRAAVGRVRAAVEASDPEAVPTAIPTLMRPDRWRATAIDREALRLGEVQLAASTPPALVPLARHLDDPAVAAALATCPGRVAGSFNRFLYAEVEPRDDGGSTVLLRDSRFATVERGYAFATTPVDLDANLRPLADGRPCPRLPAAW